MSTVLSLHNEDDYNHPNARFFYVSFGMVCKTSNGMGYASCTSITTYGSYPNLKKLEADMSKDGLYGVSVLNIIEMTKDEFTKFLQDDTTESAPRGTTYLFPATFEECPETGWFTVTFRDVPGAITQGETLADAIEMAEDALYMMLEDEEIVPIPSNSRNGDVCITVTL